MTIIWKDTTLRLHGKQHKNDHYYFRWHYGKQRVVQVSCTYVDNPTKRQVSAREAFTALRKEVARQLKDEKLRDEWLRRFEADNEGYKMLHTYVYAKIAPHPPKGGACAEQTPKSLNYGETKTSGSTGTTGRTESAVSSMRRGNTLVSTKRAQEMQHEAYSRKKGVSTPYTECELDNFLNERRYMVSLHANIQPIVMLYNGRILPIFLPAKIPKQQTG